MVESLTTNCHPIAPIVTSLVTFDIEYPENIQCFVSTHSLEGGAFTKFLKDMLVKMKVETLPKVRVTEKYNP